MEKKSDNQSIQEKADQLVRYYKVDSVLKKEDALNIVFSKIEKGEKSAIQIKSHSLLIAITSVAASIVLAITIYIFTANIEITGTSGEIATIRLPDQSRVVLQGESSVKHKKYFWNRKVQLQGEAYFEVQKGSRFVVSTRKGSVEILGTRFLVAEKQETMLVKCYEGKVNTRIDDKSFILTAGMQVSADKFDQVGQKFIKETFPSFAVFKKSYSDTEIDIIIRDVETFFGVKIKSENFGIRAFSGSFETGTVENAMEILTQPLQLNYKINGTNQFIIYKN